MSRTQQESSVRHLLGLADELDMAPRQGENESKVVVISDDAAKSIAAALRKIALDVRDI